MKNEEVYPKLLSEHEEIISRISMGEQEEAVRIVCEHIDNQVNAVMDIIRTKQN